jgi:sigma-B regulation protein RsbU (phosphoserine phosphatase)
MFLNENADKLISVEEIINGMNDWVRVVDRNNCLIYVNKAMEDALGRITLGEACYKAIGKEEPCENCISRKAVFKGHSYQKEEVIDGKIFLVMSSPVRNRKGEIIAAVEVLREITQMKKLQQTVIEQNKKLQDDLNIAKKLQCSLLPKGLPEGKIKFSFVYQPCEDLGGDFMDIFKIDDEHVGLYIADVSGHGVPASMLTVFLRSSIDKKNLSPAGALTSLFKEFNNYDFDKDVYITVFYAIINLKDYSLTYSNAGHNVSPLVFNLNENKRLEYLRVPGIPISNWLESPGYSDNKITLFKGDRVFFYTDGIIELKNSSGEQFGEERLQEILLNDTSEPNGILNRIVESACAFGEIHDTLRIPDDITMALIEMK